MVNYLLKKSYRLKDLKEVKFKDLWGDHGVFTTMWIFDNPPKILFFKDHINNLIKSTKAYSILKPSLRSDIINLLNKNLSKKKKYNHLLRIAVNKKNISISLRKRITPSLNFNLKLVNLKRTRTNIHPRMLILPQHAIKQTKLMKKFYQCLYSKILILLKISKIL